MKRILRICLLLFLPVIVAGSVLAAGTQEIDVNARYRSESTAPASYSVDLMWSDMTFTYLRQDTHTWNAQDHSYKTRSTGGWDKTKASITVTNHSNVDVLVTITYTPVENTGITGTLRNGTGSLEAGEIGDYEGADSMTATLVISGTPTDAVKESETRIGSLKVTIQ